MRLRKKMEPEKEQEKPKQKVEISLTAVRNGDRLGHDHLDSVSITVGAWRVSINEDEITVQLPFLIYDYGSYFSSKSKPVLEESSVFSPPYIYRKYKINNG